MLFTDALEFQYTPWSAEDDVYALRDNLIDLIGDYFYVAPTHEIAVTRSNFSPVYLYEFSHRPAKNQFEGASHGDNVPYDFGIPFLESSADAEGSPNFDARDRQVSWLLMTLYTNFAKYGNPTPQPVSGVTWQQFNSTTGLSCESKQIPKWCRVLIHAEWLSGINIILNWNKSSLVFR